LTDLLHRRRAIRFVDIGRVNLHARSRELLRGGASDTRGTTREHRRFARELRGLLPTQLDLAHDFLVFLSRNAAIRSCVSREARSSPPHSRSSAYPCNSVPPNAAIHCLATRCAWAGSPAMRSVIERALSSISSRGTDHWTIPSVAAVRPSTGS